MPGSDQAPTIFQLMGETTAGEADVLEVLCSKPPESRYIPIEEIQAGLKRLGRQSRERSELEADIRRLAERGWVVDAGFVGCWLRLHARKAFGRLNKAAEGLAWPFD